MNRKGFFSILLIQSSFLFIKNSNAQIPEGAKSAPTNIRANDCPCIFTDNRVLFRVTAPDAAKVQVNLGKLYDMQKK